jgi:hypothetical protein
MHYVFFCIAVISISLAICQVPPPEPIAMDNGSYVLSRPALVHEIAFMLQPHAYLIGVGTFMHLLLRMFTLTTWLRWSIAITLPTALSFGHYLWWLDYVERNNIHHPVSITMTEALLANLISFTISFGIVSLAMRWIFPSNHPRELAQTKTADNNAMHAKPDLRVV